MADFLIDLGENPTARTLIKRLGLPIPMPQRLARGVGAWAERPLEDGAVLVGHAGTPELTEVLAPALSAAGATCWVQGGVDAGSAWADAAEAFGRPHESLPAEGVPEGTTPRALVLDATGVRTVADLAGLRTFFASRIKKLAPSGRCVVLGRPHDAAQDVEQAAVRRALEGFTRSLAKEVGAKGHTANLLTVADGAEEALIGPLRWVLSPRSAFMTAQPIRIDGGHPAADPIPFTAPLEGKVALVTGAARGIGEATAATLAREGATVLCLDRPDDLEGLSLVARRVGGVPVAVDVTSEDAATVILDAVEEAGGLDIVVHNAGVTRDKTLARMDDARWDLTMAVNLEAILRLTEALVPRMNAGGRIIALSSVAGIAGNFGQTNYGASKAGVIGFVDALSGQHTDKGLTVNAIAPGFIETRLTAAIPAATREGARRLSALGQGGLPVDIAEAVTFLATPGAWGLHGQLIRVCGGALIGA